MSSKFDKYKQEGDRDIRPDGYHTVREMSKNYLKLRKSIGILGVLLPTLLVILSLINKNGCGILPSVSDYYHTSVGLVFTGLLVAIGVFLLHEGEDTKEKWACNMAGILAFIIAFAPTPLHPAYIILETGSLDFNIFSGCYIPQTANDPIIGNLHFIAATLFFLILSYLSGIKFAKSESKVNSTGKKRRLVYRICGAGMFLSLLSVAIFKIFFATEDVYTSGLGLPISINDHERIMKEGGFKIVFWAEFLMLIFFGVSWLIKGEVMLAKSKEYFK